MPLASLAVAPQVSGSNIEGQAKALAFPSRALPADAPPKSGSVRNMLNVKLQEFTD
jgi:hypothetical protein